MQTQIKQIQDSWILRFYGGMLALAHLVTAYNWFWKVPFFLNFEQNWSVCFPFFPRCERFHILRYDHLQFLVCVFGLLSVVVAALFFLRRIRLAWWGLLGLVVIKTFFYVQDYHLIHNFHYMLYFIAFIFLFFPDKENFLRVQLVLFYFSAALLKFNVEWLQGFDLLEVPPIDGIPLRVALQWVILLEFILVWGVFSKSRPLRIFVLCQLILFHAISWQQVHYFYPVSMGLLISLFFLREYAGSPLSFPMSRGVWLWMALFVSLQLIPKLRDGDPALDGRKRMFSLFMFDAKVQCVSHIVGEGSSGIVDLREPPFPVEQRIYCDPIVLEEVARTYCRLNTQDPKFDRISVFLASRRASESEWTTLIQEPDFCRRGDRGLEKPQDG